jgi:thiol-disulfide isomerase/thioredoxin
MRYMLFVLFNLFVVFIGQAQVLTDPVAAFAQAQATNRPVLLVFSGSDWCAPCIQLERQVLTDAAFLRYAKEHVVLLEADFPQRKKLPPPLVAAYEQLAETYNQEGSFPKLVVIGSDRKRVAALSALRQTPATLMAQLDRLLLDAPPAQTRTNAPPEPIRD